MQSTPNLPSLLLLKDLVQPKNPDLLPSPDFSQPLVIALQLVLMAVFEEWGISPKAVVGHSSGELAAAGAVGYLSEEDALKAAFYRGQAAKNCKTGASSISMLAYRIIHSKLGRNR